MLASLGKVNAASLCGAQAWLRLEAGAFPCWQRTGLVLWRPLEIGHLVKVGMSDRDPDLAVSDDLSHLGSAKRQRVIKAAAAMFARYGYQGVSTREIADSLGLTVSSLYFHVASKDQLLEEVCKIGIERPLHVLRHALQSAPDLASRLHLFFAAHRDELKQNADFITVHIQERQHLSKDALERVDDFSRQLRKELDRMYLEAEQRGELHPSLTPRQATMITIGTIRNLTRLYTEGPIKGFDEIVEQSAGALERGLSA